MPEAKLVISIPEDEWVSVLSRSYPDARFRILAAIPGERHGSGLAEITSESIQTVLEEMRAHENIESMNVLNETDETALVQFETSLPLLLLAARDSGVPLSMPFEISEGSAIWELTVPTDRLSALGTQLEDAGIDYRIEYIQPEIDEDSLLTDAQEKVIRVAIESGYYETPRECDLEEIAGKLDLAKSTVSKTLQRAEGRIVRQYMATDGVSDRGAG